MAVGSSSGLLMALKIGIGCGNFELLKYLFGNYAIEGHMRNSVQDDQGNTLIHYLCKTCQKDGTAEEAALRLLLNYDLDPMILNKEKKLAIDYVHKDMQLYKILNDKQQKIRGQITAEIETIKMTGNIAYKNEDYVKAIAFYSEGIQKVQKIRDFDPQQRAILYNNRAAALIALQRYPEAYKDAQTSVTIDSNYANGYRKLARICTFQGKFDKAAESFANCFEKLKNKSTKDSCDLLIGLTKCTVKISGNKRTKHLNRCNAKSEIWADVIKSLVVNHEWYAVHMLFLGGGHGYHKGQGGAASCCDLNNLSLFDLTHALLADGQQKSEMKHLLNEVLAKLIEHHADIGTMKLDDSAPFRSPINSAILLGVNVGNFQVLKVVVHMYPNLTRFWQRGIRGPLHFIAGLHVGMGFNIPELNWLIQFLIDKGIDPLYRDDDGSLAIDLFIPFSSASRLLKQKMESVFTNGNQKYPMKSRATRTSFDEDIPSKIKTTKPEQPQVKVSNGDSASQERSDQSQPLKENSTRKPKNRQLQQEKTQQPWKATLTNLLSNSAAKIVSILRDTPEQFLMTSSAFGEETVKQNKAIPSTTWKGGARPKEKLIKESQQPEEIAARRRVQIFDRLSELPQSKYREILTQCSKQQQWKDIFDLIKLRRRKKNCTVEGLATYICLTSFIKSQDFDVERMEILIKCGASVEAKNSEDPPIQAVAKLGNVSAINILLKNGCDYNNLSTEKGDTYLHAALRLCISKGNFDLLEHFLDEIKYPHVNPNIQDSDGNTLFHVVASERFTKSILKAANILNEHSVNPNLLNKHGKPAAACLEKKNDKRRHILNLAGGKYTKPDIATKANNGVHHSAEEIPVNTNQASPSNETTKLTLASVKLQLQKHVNCLPDQIENCFLDPLGKIDPDEDTDEEEDQDNYWTGTCSASCRSDETIAVVSNCSRPESRSSVDSSSRSTPSPLLHEEEDECASYDISTDNFDGLEWEVECTPDVWKKLYNKRSMDIDLKECIVKKIKMLAGGDWRPNLVHKIKQVSSDIRLFRVKIPGGRSFIWELAVAFSPRLNDSFSETDDTATEENAKIYSEIIRIWDIILDYKDFHHVLERIVKSHKRGHESFLQKQLKNSKQVIHQKSEENKRLPKLFLEEGLKDIPSTTSSMSLSPLACPSETEYQIMKFYSFNASLINTILHNQGVKVDFPFRVTDDEHKIINLQPSPPCPILLVGRSGTGKTTCLLYRLWTRFVRYWQHAVTNGPWIPRHSKYELLPVETGEGSGNEDEEKAENDDDEDCCQYDILACLKQEPDSSEDSDPIYEHLHQIFITKNAVLCTEVQKNFKELTHASEITQARVAVENEPLPNRIQDIHPDAYPIFVSSKEFLLLLDASLPGKTFFPRNEDGSLNCEVKGWRGDDAPMSFLPEIDVESDSENEEDENDLQKASKKRMKSSCHEWREVTYEVFAHELWPFINKGRKYQCHPTLVWMEINSFIKGSAKAMMNFTGYLTKDEYLQFGNKQAPNFCGSREDVYEMFLNYRHVIRQFGMFDECDVVHNVFYRLDSLASPDWSLHEFYVDETQDFTQAELCLLIRCCQSPNDMFLTGDTAQSIMRGVAFRFRDLKSLYFFARDSLKVIGKEAAIGIPRRIYPLTHNYRSHAGILALATSIVDLMEHFFPDSFDHLEKDQGLFTGPKPVLLTSCCVKDLALLLCDHKRDTTHIEFGAHQTILVANDEARKNLPMELSHGLVLTIFESKGLEFDDVLLYNFFKDSQAHKEWRVVREFIDEQVKKQKADKNINSNLKVVDLDVFKRSDASRPLHFDPQKHKVLNSELKYLYTALTRARVNVWIFDEDEELRKPMFEYFQALGLVQCVDVPDGKVASDLLFAKQSTVGEWKKRGDEFYRKRMFELAATCYDKADRSMLQSYCLAHHHAVEAGSFRNEPTKLRSSFLKAAELYLMCERFEEAAKCLYNARQFHTSAQLSEKLGHFYEAGVRYRKANSIMDAAKAFERGHRYKEAVNLLGSGLTYELAIDIVERFNKLAKKSQGLPPEATSPVHTVKDLCLNAASYYLKHDKHEYALDALRRGLEDRHEEIVAFLTRERQYLIAADYLGQRDKVLDAAQLLRKFGKLEDALKLLDQFQPQNDNDKCFIAECFLTLGRKALARERFEFSMSEKSGTTDIQCISESVPMNIDLPTTNVEQIGSIDSSDNVNSSSPMKSTNQQYTEKVLNLIDKAGRLYASAKMKEFSSSTIANVAECEMYKGYFSGSSDAIVKACEKFVKINNAIGALECLDLMSKLNGNAFFNYQTCRQLVIPCIEKLKILVPLFFGKATSYLEKDMIRQCELFYGLDSTGEDLAIKQEEGARILHLLIHKNPENRESTSVCSSVILADMIDKLSHILGPCVDVFHEVFLSNAPCHWQKVGLECMAGAACKQRHEVNLREHHHKQITSAVNLIMISAFVDVLFDGIRGAEKIASYQCKENVENARILLTDLSQKRIDNLRKSCKRLMRAIFPVHRQELYMCDFYPQARDLINFTKTVSDDLLKQVEHRWNTASESEKVSSIELYMEIQKMLQIAGRPHLIDFYLKKAETMENSPTNKGFFRIKTGNEFHEVSYYRMYLISKHTLHEKKFPFRSVGNVNELLMKIANRAHSIMIPTFGDTMLLLEYQLIVCFAMLLRSSQGAHVFIPSSYLAQIHLMDAIYASQRSKTLYDVVQYQESEFNKWRRIQGLVDQIVKLFCGAYKEDFNILAEAFSESDYIQSGEAERVLVFALVLLVNLDINGPVHVYHETPLKEILNQIQCNPDVSPRRLIISVNAVQKAKGWHDICRALRWLLDARGKEHLYKCSWIWEPFRNGRKGLQYQRFDDKIHTTPNVFSSCVGRKAEDEASVYEQDNTGKLTSDEFKSIIKSNQVYKDSQCEEPIEDEDYQTAPKSMIESLFPSDPIDDSMCNICNIHFTHHSHQMRTHIQDIDYAEENDPEPNQSDVTSLRIAHEKSDEHRRGVNIYQECKNNIRVSFEPLFESIALIMAKGKQVYDDTTYAQQWVQSLESLQKVHEQVNAEISKIVKTKEWMQYKNLQHLHSDLSHCLKFAQKIDKEAHCQGHTRANDLDIDDPIGMSGDIEDDFLPVHYGRKRKQHNGKTGRKSRP
ncbi:TPR and ankyrin repeat-containing protein 1-like [Tubulanus polymorphus]|uniref:TPR and ankyrin repeat-containing protein 1-like n=1 Tax=Tubulanus polymorphus TaxID=672921 RepID=UPI003DA2BD09